MTPAVRFLIEVIAEHADSPWRYHGTADGRSAIICWEVNGVEWTATSGHRGVMVHADHLHRPIVTTDGGDPAFRVAVLSASLACFDGVRL